MKYDHFFKIVKLLLSTVVVFLVVYVLYETFHPPITAESLIKSINQHDSYEKLEHALESNDIDNRLAAVKALFILNTEEAFKLLRIAVDDPATVVRVAIVNRIRDLPEKWALRLILMLLDDREYGIVRDSIATLEMYTGKDYNFRFGVSASEKALVIEECRQDIYERLNHRKD